MKVGFLKISLTILLSLCTAVNCYKILGVFPLNSKSHFTVFEVLMKTLADRGHQVDVVSSFPLKQTYNNYHDIIELTPTYPSLVNNITYDDIHNKMGSLISMVKTQRGNDVCHALGNLNLMKIINNPTSDVSYDVVITEMFIANCFVVIGHLLKVPVVGVSTYGRLPWVYDIMGNPEYTDFITNEITGEFYPGFWNRMVSFIGNTYEKLSFYHKTKEQDSILTKYFGKNIPKVRELESSVALTLTNSHFISHGMAPLVPGLIEVGGMHIVDKHIDPLFIDIAEFLDTSQHGVVYVNLGEDVLFETFPKHIVKAFYSAFEKINPIRVLMRVRDFNALPEGIPTNVVVLPYVQQYRVLQHPNVRAFITHGGLLSVQEAMSTGTAMVGIPLWGDHFENVDIVVKHNMGLRVDLHSITENSLGLALNTTLRNSTYRDNARKMKNKFFDRPEVPVDTACYWIEYVVKHGSNSLKYHMMKLSLFQSLYFDVFSFFTLIILTVIFLFMLFINFMMMKAVGKLRSQPKSKKLL